jgi:hypothetical protein
MVKAKEGLLEGSSGMDNILVTLVAGRYWLIFTRSHVAFTFLLHFCWIRSFLTHSMRSMFLQGEKG